LRLWITRSPSRKIRGKINRRALEDYDNESIKHSQQFSYITPPSTYTEKKLVKILEDFFKIHIGINYSFTSIGGNSLLAMQIVSRVHDQFSVEIPAYSLLSDTSLTETARRIDKLLSER